MVLPLLLYALSGCSAPGNSGVDVRQSASTVSTVSPVPEPTSSPFDMPDPDSTPQSVPIKLGLEERWLTEVDEALRAMPPDSLQVEITLQPVDPTLDLLEQETVDLLLVQDPLGEPVIQRPIVLAVPWTSAWEQITLAEAEALLNEGSDFVAVLEWPEVPPTLKPLKIDGHHPSHSDYPLKKSWSLYSRAGLEPVATQVAGALSPFLVDHPVKLTAVGDIMLARGLGDRIVSGEDPHPFAAVSHLLADADLTLGNLESALGEGGPAESKGYTFLAPPQAAETIASAGFDVLSLANNHALDYGPQTLLQAIEILENQGVSTVGAGANLSQAITPLVVDRNGIDIGILSFVDVPVEVRGFDTRSWSAREDSAGVAWADPELLQTAIGSAKGSADILIVLLHSGYEYIDSPSPPQQLAARLAIDAGANLVIGHHTHVLQGVEYYANGVIVYGLGNFAFEDSGVSESGLMNIWIDRDGIRSLEFIPLILGQDGRPFPADPLRAESILARYYSLTRSVDRRDP